MAAANRIHILGCRILLYFSLVRLMNDKREIDGLVIREVEPADHEGIERITLSVFGPSTFERNVEEIYGRIGGKDWKWRKMRHLASDLADPCGRCLVAEMDGAVVGYVTIKLDAEAAIGVIPNLAVESDFAGFGIGSKLIDSAVKVMTQAGMEVARIETLEQNQIGQHLYPKQGFTEFARQIYFAKDLKVQDGQ